MTTSALKTSLLPLSHDSALEKLRETRLLSPDVVEGLGLSHHAVRNWRDLPSETRESMVDALIDRFLDA